MKTEIEQFDPCKPAKEFRRQFSTFKEAWEACPRGDWMLWIAFELGVDERKLFLAKGLCANTVRDKMEDERSLEGVDIAIAYGRGEISRNELKKDAVEAYETHAGVIVSSSFAAAAASAIYTAALASDAATFASAAASYAASSDTCVAYDADAYAAKKENQMQTADICREVLTEEVMEKINRFRKE